MQMPYDFPPVPKCFSHLLNNFSNYESENDDVMLSQSLPLSMNVKNSIHDLNNTNRYIRSLSENSQSYSYSHSQVTITDCNGGITSGNNSNVFYQDVFTEDDRVQGIDVTQNQRITPKPASFQSFHTYTVPSPRSQKRVIIKQSSFDLDDEEEQNDEKLTAHQDLSNPFVKLNSSLEKLQKEMNELRQFDFSLFWQLLSLNESIQDLKNFNDRYSETGSECSLGSASYMGSMSSLDEESDWGDNQFLMQSLRGDESVVDDDENRQSTSSLLEQIAALTQKAEEDI